MLSAAFGEITLKAEIGDPTKGYTGATIQKAVGPLKTVVAFLQSGRLEVGILATHHVDTWSNHFSQRLRDTAAQALNIPAAKVLLFCSHNHCVPLLENDPIYRWNQGGKSDKGLDLLPGGHKMVEAVARVCKTLRKRLEPVTVSWAVGSEGRITYCRKGRRADGSSYFMREEDRKAIARDYWGDIETDAPVVCFRNAQGRAVGFLVQYTGHPVTAYNPETFTCWGEWPQTACDLLSETYQGAPAAFLQGCCGDVSSKYMFSGDIALSARFGKYLGSAYIKAAKKLQESQRNDMTIGHDIAHVPLAALPTAAKLQKEILLMEDFIRRAKEGKGDLYECVGLNFPKALSPAYRGKLVEAILPWNQWALKIRKEKQTDRLPKYLEMPITTLRVGDVGIIAMPCEPFMGIGRLIKKNSPLPLSIPCGYANLSYGYLIDGANIDGNEYMSTFYRYTQYFPPYKKPAGDVLAAVSIQRLKQLAKFE